MKTVAPVSYTHLNNHSCLRDATGGRRFWPIDIDIRPRTKNVFIDLPNERDQIWAEAVIRWKAGEPLFLKGEIEQAAVQKLSLIHISGSKGVGCGLGNVMKTRDGEPLSGGASAASDFCLLYTSRCV